MSVNRWLSGVEAPVSGVEATDIKNIYMTITPYKNSKSGKKEQIAEMFDNIAPKYDFLNHFLSFGIDKSWRKKVIKILKKYQPKTIIDVATGTADLAIMASKLNPDKITGIDISAQMLSEGWGKIIKKQQEDKIELVQCDSESIIFEDNSFDAGMVAFGVRNFENLDKGLKEINRVLKPGAPLVVLEFSKPKQAGIKQLYAFYSKHILPAIGKSISKDNAAYSYLPESINLFPEDSLFLKRLEDAGFINVKQRKLTFGIASIYLGIKA